MKTRYEEEEEEEEDDEEEEGVEWLTAGTLLGQWEWAAVTSSSGLEPITVTSRSSNEKRRDF